MPFDKDISEAPAGHTKGATSRVNEEIRKRIVAFLDDNFNDIKTDLKELIPNSTLDSTDLFQFGLPRLKALDMNVSYDQVSNEDLDLIINILKNGTINERTKN